MRTTGEAGSGQRAAAPWPLLAGFAMFVIAMGYLVASSFTRRAAPTFAPTVEARGDTLTVDATDGRRWRYLSLARGRVLTGPDTVGWDLAIRRYNVRVSGGAFDFGEADFSAFGTRGDAPRGVVALGPPRIPDELGKWYRYSLLTHLLESNRHVYVTRPGARDSYKVQILSYYCPGLTAGCLTLRFAPLTSGN
jgi:hypothetical protein